jgi:secreted PhoX family phosphatase
MWFGRNELYFACTNGGHISKGQIFRYTPSPEEGTPREGENPGQLELFVEPNNTDLVKSCDNLTVSPWGDLIVCEDDAHPFVVGITPTGQFYRLAENVGFRSEFAGGVFSPDGSTYFVNIQHAGLTLAVTGPWRV